MNSSNLTWDIVKRMRDVTKMKIVLKGIVTAEDAELAVQNGMDGILLSNHGGRGEDNGRSTIDALPEILAAVKGQMPVFIDGGFRRGTDVVKALAMGAKAVGIGRPYLWGLERSARRVLRACSRSCARKRGLPCNNAACVRSVSSIRISSDARAEPHLFRR